MLPDIRKTRMALNGKVAAVKSVEEVETDGKLITEDVRMAAQDSGMTVVHHPLKRNFQQIAIAFKHHPVLRNDELKRPGIVHRIPVQLRNVLLEPLSAPGARFKPGTHAERGAAELVNTLLQIFAEDPGRRVRTLAVYHNIHPVQQAAFVIIQHYPVYKIGAFIHFICSSSGYRTEIGDCPRAHTILQFVL